MNPGTPLLLAAACAALGIAVGTWFSRTWLALLLAATTTALAAALAVLLGMADWEWTSAFPVAGERLHFRLDGVSALFLALVCVVGGAGAAYAREYWSDQRDPGAAARGRVWWSGLVLSMGVVLLTSNGLHFLIGWELFAVSAYFLITLDGRRRDVRAAGWLYLAASHAGTVCLFAFFATLAARTGSWELGPVREQLALAPLFWIALAGFSVKAGVFPVHIWLPSAHANAPSHVSAIMSGVAIKMGIYGLVRFGGWLPVPPAAGWVVIGLGATSALLGIAFAFAQNDLKRLLAYCSVENIGIILIGVGLALLGAARNDAPWGRLALAGSLLHVWNHGAFKSLLFFGAGNVLHATGTREMSRLGGVWRTMPWTAGLFALGSVAVAGLPPLNGFVSEWLIYLGLFDAAASQGPFGWAALPAAVMLAMAGALAMATFAKAFAVVFLGAPRTQAAKTSHECGPRMLAPMFVMAAACVAVGLAPMLFWPAISRAVGAWHPAWSGVAVPAPLAMLGSAHGALAILSLMAGALLWRKARSNGLLRAPTWDCGYARPTARMQYTSGSFAGIAAGWFSWLLAPVRRVRHPRGPLPAHAVRMERHPDTMLERVIVPAGRAVLQASAAVRRLQHGRLQSYILYVVTGLVGVGVLVLAGVRR